MKKFHHNLILFGIVLFALTGLVEVVLKRNIKPHVGLKYDEIYNPKIAADIIVLGTSHAAHSINPCFMDLDSLSVYNFAINGCTPKYYLKWYTKIVREKYPKPKYLIYAVDWAMFDDTWGERSFDVDARFWSLPVFIDVLLHDADLNKKTLLYNRSNLLFNRKQLQYIFFKRKKFDFLDVEAMCNGYVPHFAKKVKMGKSPVKSPISKRWQADFNQLLDLVEEDGIEVVFVNVPEYIPSWQTSVIPERFAYLDSIAEARGISFLNYNMELKTEMNYDSTLFNNWIHLNDIGATEFSKTLSGDLIKIVE